MEDVTTGIILDIRRAKKDGTYPVKLRVTYLRKQKYYPTKFSFIEEEFNAIMKRNPRKKEYKETQLKLQAIETRATEIIDDMGSFSFNLFYKRFTNGKVKTKIDHQDIYASIDRYIAELNQDGKISTALLYGSTKKSLQSYCKELVFADVTPEFLQKYEDWMREQNNTYSTIGIYTRNLRTIFNLAMEDGHISRDLYPFGRRRYQTPTGTNIKKALIMQDLKKIFDYQPETDSEAMYRDLWVFSYLANGINIKDMLRLKYRNIEDGKITFQREKTKRSNRTKPKNITAPITPELKQIIRKWGNRDNSPNNFVFPYLTDDTTPQRELEIKRQLIKQINKYIRIIATKVGISKDVTTYVARHSFATVLKRSGTSIEFISESLGHRDLRTTENYLDSFEDDMKQEFAKALTNFK